MPKQLTNLFDIPNKKYQGYVWLSNAAKPVVLNSEYHDFSQIGINPFVIEALLWCEEDQISVVVRHTGTYRIHEYDLKSLAPGAELVEKEFLPHRLGSYIKKVKFKQLWLPEQDQNCEGLYVLTMKALIFTGFKYKTQKS